MSENREITINQIPSPTWNWLHINDSNVKAPGTFSLGNVLQDIPSGISAKENPSHKIDAKSAMGDELSKILEESGIKILEYKAASGQKVKEPIRLTFSYRDGEEKANSVELVAEENSEMLVIMDFTSDKNLSGAAAIQTRYQVKDNAKIHLVQIERLGDGFDFYNDICGDLGEKGQFVLTQLILNGNHSYYGIRNELSGKKSSVKSDIAYLVDREEILDMNYVSNHTGRKTESSMNCDGVLRDKADKVFRGTIDFHRGCGGSKGDELENVLLMDDDVINRTIPVILCDEEDVEGNHGASIGKLDESLLFYMTSRGLSLEEIYEMMARARLDAVAQKIPDEEIREEVAKFLGETED